MDLERVINAMLDEKLATIEMKKELAEILGVGTHEIEFVELLTDEMNIHQCVAICFKQSVVLHKINLQKLNYDYITVDTEGRLILVLRDEPL